MSLLTSINFLFLTSLAIISWFILCYFHKIEERKLEEFKADFKMEKVFVDEAIVKAAVSKCQPNYDIYLNVICIFACIYGLVKITNFTENYVVRRLHSKFAYGVHHGIGSESSPSADNRNKLQNLMVQVACLEKQNKMLEYRLQELQQFSLQMHLADESGKDDGGGIAIRTEHQRQQPIFVNEGNVKLDIHPANNWRNEDNGNFSQIWQKYLELRGYLSIDDKQCNSEKYSYPCLAQLPAVMSLEELNKTDEIYKCL